MVVSLKLFESLRFQSFFTGLFYVLLDDKQKDKSRGVDIPWILPIFDHGKIILLSLLYLFGVCFRVIFRFRYVLDTLVILELFEMQNCTHASDVSYGWRHSYSAIELIFGHKI